jgi:uncharacterized RDD family membrane protein YckC
MKCPKCSYLGFETGDRCKNCGYDFSLMAAASEPKDVDIQLDRALPLFARSMDDDGDEPLIRLPAAPRPPLAVRRTPEIPRLRAVPRPAKRAEPALEFSEDAEPDADLAPEPPVPAPAVTTRPHHAETGSVGARAGAVVIDHAILMAIDLGVLYFTLRMAGLSMASWRALPAAPFITFLVFLKMAYFCAFTAVGGQTIGKMATKIRVVTDADEAVDGARALQRTIAAAVSALVFGLGFVPALISGERRALHDRVAHTRVVTLRSV